MTRAVLSFKIGWASPDATPEVSLAPNCGAAKKQSARAALAICKLGLFSVPSHLTITVSPKRIRLSGDVVRPVYTKRNKKKFVYLRVTRAFRVTSTRCSMRVCCSTFFFYFFINFYASELFESASFKICVRQSNEWVLNENTVVYGLMVEYGLHKILNGKFFFIMSPYKGLVVKWKGTMGV